MKSLSVSISGSAQVSDELATKVQEVAAALNELGIYTSVGITDVPEQVEPPKEEVAPEA